MEIIKTKEEDNRISYTIIDPSPEFVDFVKKLSSKAMSRENLYRENLQKIEERLQDAADLIKATLIAEHPANCGDKLVEIADALANVRHKLIDLLHE